jgi:hypothetical protein
VKFLIDGASLLFVPALAIGDGVHIAICVVEREVPIAMLVVAGEAQVKTVVEGETVVVDALIHIGVFGEVVIGIITVEGELRIAPCIC